MNNNNDVNTSMEVGTNSNDAAKMDAITTINSSTASTVDLVSTANHNPSMEVDGTIGTADTATTGMVEISTTTNSSTTNSTTSTTSSSDDAVIDEIESIFNKEFPPGKRFPSLEALKVALSTCAKKYGFEMSGSGKCISCCSGGKSRSNENDSKRSKIASLKVGCEFMCNWAYVVGTYPDPTKEYGTTTIARYRNTPELQEVRIQPSSQYRHTMGCKPSYQLYQYHARRLGRLFDKESVKMNDLLSLLELSRWRMDNESLRSHLSLINPSQSYITADELRNFRWWAKKEFIKRTSSKKDMVLTEKDLKDMFSSEVIAKPDSSVAIEQAEELYRNLLQSTMESNGNTWKVERYLSSIKKADECFDFRIGRDSMTGSATIVVWQTGTMRADFELYGCTLYLDFMKRKLNSYEWPYISIVAMDSNGSPRVVAEGIACTERHAAYVTAVRSVLDMSPGRTNKEVFAVFADGALNHTILQPHMMDLPNCKFIWDSFHLYSDVWPKLFGGSWCETLSSGLCSMLYANSEEDFNAALSTLQTTYAGNSNILNKVDGIAKDKQYYAKYLIQSYLGTCGKTSSNPAEQNHWSIVSHIGGALYEDPSSEVRLLLGRQRDHEKKRNQEKAKYHFSIPADISRSKRLRDTPCLKAAKQKLDKKPFLQWQDEYDNSRNYTCQVCSDTGSRTFTHSLYPNAKRVLEAGARCSCSIRMQFLTQCRHEIAEQNDGDEFQPDLIDKRNHFFFDLHTKVKRGSNIAGEEFKQDSATQSSSTSIHFDVSKADDDLLSHGPVATASSAPTSYAASSYSSGTRRTSTFNYKDIMGVAGDIAQMAVSRGEEHSKSVMGLMCQIEGVIRTNGQLVKGDTDDILENYSRTFSGTQTNAVSFSLNAAPPAPPKRPGSRAPESRIKGASMEACKAQAVAGGRAKNKCSFCKRTRDQGCGNVSTCTTKNEFGVHLKNSTEIDLLHSYIDRVCQCGDATFFSLWPQDKRSELQLGVPTAAKHIVVHGVHSYQSSNGPTVIVAAVQFLIEGGKELLGYEYIPITLKELTKVLHKKFSAKEKCVFINNGLYSAVSTG